MTPNLLLAGADGVDFMIHGIFKYNFLGHEVWITTSHVCLLIVVVSLLIFFFIGGLTMEKLLSLVRRCVEDYDMIKNAALEQKKYEAMEKWVKEKVKKSNLRKKRKKKRKKRKKKKSQQNPLKKCENLINYMI